jgi:hypothetical protein
MAERVLSGIGSPQRVLAASGIHDTQDASAIVDALKDELVNRPAKAVVNFVGARTASQYVMNLVNVEFPYQVASASLAFGTHFVHFGSAAEITHPIQQLPAGQQAWRDEYGSSKSQGTTRLLELPNVTVLRVYNLRGLPHQEGSGLHRLCRGIRNLFAQTTEVASPLVNTVRDYVHLNQVSRMLVETIDDSPRGLVEVCSGVGVSIEEIVDSLPAKISEGLKPSLVAPDRFGPVIGRASAVELGEENRESILREIREEVLACAFS